MYYKRRENLNLAKLRITGQPIQTGFFIFREFLLFGDGSGGQKLIFEVSGISRKMGLRQVELGFSSFLAKFLTYLMIFQSFEESLSMLHFEKFFKYAKKMAKNEEKSCSTCLKIHFSMALLSKKRKPVINF